MLRLSRRWADLHLIAFLRYQWFAHLCHSDDCLLQAFYYGHVDVKCVPGGLRTHSGIIYPKSGAQQMPVQLSVITVRCPSLGSHLSGQAKPLLQIDVLCFQSGSMHVMQCSSCASCTHAQYA